MQLDTQTNPTTSRNPKLVKLLHIMIRRNRHTLEKLYVPFFWAVQQPINTLNTLL